MKGWDTPAIRDLVAFWNRRLFPHSTATLAASGEGEGWLDEAENPDHPQGDASMDDSVDHLLGIQAAAWDMKHPESHGKWSMFVELYRTTHGCTLQHCNSRSGSTLKTVSMI